MPIHIGIQMNHDPRLSYRNAAHRGLTQPGWFTRIVAVSLGSLMLGAAVVAAVMFSLIVLPVILLVGAVGVGYLWFKTRPLRRQLNEQMQAIRAEFDRQAAGAGRDGGSDRSGSGATAGAGSRSARTGDVLDGDYIQEARHDK